MWEIVSERGVWLVRHTGSGVVDCRRHSESAAQARCDALNASTGAMTAAGAVGEANPQPEGRPFYAVLAVDEYLTADGYRYFEHFEWETLPLTLYSLDSQSMGGHLDAEACGSIRTIERLSDGRRIFATGFLNTTEEGRLAEAQVESQSLRFISVDPADYEVDEEITKIGTDGWPIDGRSRFTNYVIGAATILGTPAIRLAVMWLDGMEEPAELTEVLPDPVPAVQIPEIVDVEEDDSIVVVMASASPEGEAPPYEREPAGAYSMLGDDRETRALLASAISARANGQSAARCLLTHDCGGPALASRDFFANPELGEPTPPTVTREGRHYGHLAIWGRPHRGFLHYQWSDDVLAPRNHSGYREFLVHRTPLACCDDPGCGHERESIRTGVLVVGTTHAGKRLSAAAAQAFYENTGYQTSDVVVGEDDVGIWYSGALRPGLDDGRVREVLGASPSGDWRWIGGDLELVAALGVNTAGFPAVQASAHIEDDEIRTLITGWTPGQQPDEALIASVAGELQRRLPVSSRRAPLRAELRLDTAEAVAAIERVLDRRLGPIEAVVETLGPLAAERLEADIQEMLQSTP